MHGWETRMLLKHYLDRGVSKAELSRRFGVSRRTIHEWVVTGQLDRDLSSEARRGHRRRCARRRPALVVGTRRGTRPGWRPRAAGRRAKRRGGGALRSRPGGCLG